MSLVDRIICRVLLTCIKQLGKYPCPTCLVLKQNVQYLGTASDADMRVKNSRIDNEKYRDKIRKARDHIYLRGDLLNGQCIEHLLGSGSIVPTQVCEMIHKHHRKVQISAERILVSLIRVWVQLLLNVCTRSTS